MIWNRVHPDGAVFAPVYIDEPVLPDKPQTDWEKDIGEQMDKMQRDRLKSHLPDGKYPWEDIDEDVDDE